MTIEAWMCSKLLIYILRKGSQSGRSAHSEESKSVLESPVDLLGKLALFKFRSSIN